MSNNINTERFIEDIYSMPIIWNRNCTSNKALTEKSWIELSNKYLTSIPILKAKWKGLRDMFRVEIKRIPCNDAGEAEILPQEFESKWTHYKALLFLADHMRSRRTQYNIMDPIQKMEVLDSYPVMLNGYSAPNRQINGDTETLPASTINPSANVVKCDPDTQVKHNKRRNSIPESLTDETSATFPLPESSSEHKRRKINTFDASANSSENGDKLINDDYHFLMSLQPFMSELSRTQKLRLRMKMQKLVFDELYGNIDM